MQPNNEDLSSDQPRNTPDSLHSEALPTIPNHYDFKQRQQLIETALPSREPTKQSLEQNVKTNDSVTVDHAKDGGLIAKLRSYVRTAASSPGFWAGTGSAAICAGSSVAGLTIFSLATLWALRNEERSGNRLQSEEAATEDIETAKTAKGVQALLKEIAKSPGFNLTVSAASWIISTAEAIARGQIAAPTAFMNYFTGSAATASVLNKDYKPEPRKHTWAERLAKRAWKVVPTRIKTVLKDPAPWFTMGNIILGVTGLSLATITNAPIVGGMFLAGLAVAGASFVKGMTPLFSKKVQNKPTGTASYLNAAANVLLGSANLLGGSLPVGIAFACWALSNTFLGRRMNQDNETVST